MLSAAAGCAAALGGIAMLGCAVVCRCADNVARDDSLPDSDKFIGAPGLSSRVLSNLIDSNGSLADKGVSIMLVINCNNTEWRGRSLYVGGQFYAAAMAFAAEFLQKQAIVA